MLRIDFSKDAEFDLEEIIDFIALDSVDRALKYLEKIEDNISLLSENAHLGVLCKRKNIQLGCRILIFEGYLIFYKVLEDAILIIRILHGSVNYKKILV
jgi:toxin ParE1/3/4